MMTILNPLFLVPALSGIIFLITGWIMFKNPPKEINGMYGYRTASSMKSQERWDFAQKLATKETLRLGLFQLVLSLAGIVFGSNKPIFVFIGTGICLAAGALLIIRVEIAIKKRFGTKQL